MEERGAVEAEEKARLADVFAGEGREERSEAGRDVRACDEDGGVLLTLHAPTLDDLVSVAERHEVMSPKTTYVKPKPRTGVFLR